MAGRPCFQKADALCSEAVGGGFLPADLRMEPALDVNLMENPPIQTSTAGSRSLLVLVESGNPRLYRGYI